jgi:hypothetical protein
VLRDSSVGIATGYARPGFNSRQGQEAFLFTFRIGSVAHLSSHPMGTGILSLGQSNTHLHLVRKLRLMKRIPPLSRYNFVAWCVMEQHRDNFTFWGCEQKRPGVYQGTGPRFPWNDKSKATENEQLDLSQDERRVAYLSLADWARFAPAKLFSMQTLIA